MTDRAADDFDAIRARLEEIRQEETPVATCGVTNEACVQGCAVDDKGTVFCKKAADGGVGIYYVAESGFFQFRGPYEQSWAVRRNRVRGW